YKMLVTGGDSAIGRAAAIAYAKEGADVAINYLPSEEQDAQEVRQVIEESGQKAVLIPGDIRDEQFNYDLVEQAYQQLGGLDNVTLVAGHQQ
ncbi:SDR family NAD(P)-dependent oxidoreductase, partial [Staphylococcus condimenti]